MSKQYITLDTDDNINKAALIVSKYNKRLSAGESLNKDESEELEYYQEHIWLELEGPKFINKNDEHYKIVKMNKYITASSYLDTILEVLGCHSTRKGFFDHEKSPVFLGYFNKLLKMRSTNSCYSSKNGPLGMTGPFYYPEEKKEMEGKIKAEIKKSNPDISEDELGEEVEKKWNEYLNRKIAKVGVSLDEPISEDGYLTRYDSTPSNDNLDIDNLDIDNLDIKEKLEEKKNRMERIADKVKRMDELKRAFDYCVGSKGERTDIKIFDVMFTHDIVKVTEQEKKEKQLNVGDIVKLLDEKKIEEHLGQEITENNEEELFYSNNRFLIFLCSGKYYDTYTKQRIQSDFSDKLYELLELPYVAYVKVEPENYYVDMKTAIIPDLEDKDKFNKTVIIISDYLEFSTSTVRNRIYNLGNKLSLYLRFMQDRWGGDIHTLREDLW